MKKTAYPIFAICLLAGLCALSSCSKKTDPGPGPEIDGRAVLVTFDDMPEEMMASDVYGSNLYGTGYYWLDKASGLGSKPYDDQFYSGGTAVSKFSSTSCLLTEDNSSEWYKYQLAVNSDNGMGWPGHYSAKACLVAFGTSATEPWGRASQINFTDSEKTERMIEQLSVCNTVYANTYMTVDAGFNKVMSISLQSFLKVKFIGYDAAGRKTGEVETYLAKFFGDNPFGVLNGWQRVPLLGLGKIHTLVIDIEGSDMGDYGLNTPAYVAIDDILVLLEENEQVAANKNFIL